MEALRTCDVCHQAKNRVQLHKTSGLALCGTCYKNRFAPKAQCQVCRKVATVAKRLDDGKALCADCYSATRTKEACSLCGNERVAHSRNAKGRSICGSCHLALRAPEKCCFCAKKKRVAGRTEHRHAVCGSCYRVHYSVRELCSVCGEQRLVGGRTDDGKPICGPCRFNKIYLEECRACGEARPVQQRDADGKPICPRCYMRKRRAAKKGNHVPAVVPVRTLTFPLAKTPNPGEVEPPVSERRPVRKNDQVDSPELQSEFHGSQGVASGTDSVSPAVAWALYRVQNWNRSLTLAVVARSGEEAVVQFELTTWRESKPCTARKILELNSAYPHPFVPHADELRQWSSAVRDDHVVEIGGELFVVGNGGVARNLYEVQSTEREGMCFAVAESVGEAEAVCEAEGVIADGAGRAVHLRKVGRWEKAFIPSDDLLLAWGIRRNVDGEYVFKGRCFQQFPPSIAELVRDVEVIRIPPRRPAAAVGE